MSTELADWRRKYGVRFYVEPADSNPNADSFGPDARHWLVTLKTRQGTIEVPFSQGSAHTEPPTAEDVLDCLASDAAGFENAASLEDWASEYGYDEYDPDDWSKACRIFEAVEKQSTELRACLGNEAYEALLWETERS